MAFCFTAVLLAAVIISPKVFAAVYCVAPGGTGCDGSICIVGCHAGPQWLADHAADGDEIRIAAGTYGPAQMVTFLDGSAFINLKQVLLIREKNLAVGGGYALSNWTWPDPENNLTYIDAGGSGRAVTVWGSGYETVTLGGLRMINGNYEGLGNPVDVDGYHCPRTSSDCGGGLLAKLVSLVMTDCLIQSCTAGETAPYTDGGGAMFWALLVGSRLERVWFSSNQSKDGTGRGGGLMVYYGRDLLLEDCVFYTNEAEDDGGGLCLFQPHDPVTLRNVRFYNNTAATGSGGALAAAVVSTPGVYDFVYNRGIVYNNHAVRDGAAVHLERMGVDPVRAYAANLFLVQNSTINTSNESSLFRVDSNASDNLFQILHCTALVNTPKTFLYTQGSATPGTTLTVGLYNSVLDGFANGLGLEEQTAGGDVAGHLAYSVLHDVPIVWFAPTGAPSINQVGNFVGDPLLDSGGSPNFDSLVRNMGVATYVTDDLHGRARDAWPDAGAMEYVAYRLQGPFELLLEQIGLGGIRSAPGRKEES